MDIVENLKEVHGKIDRAYDRAKEFHNENGEVMLCTVTKTRSISEIREAVDAGEIHPFWRNRRSGWKRSG